MIRENKYFLLVGLDDSNKLGTFVLIAKREVGPHSKPYLFDILLGVLSTTEKVHLLVSIDQFFVIKYLQAFGGFREGYFYFKSSFNKFSLESYSRENLVFCDHPNGGQMYGISIKLDNTIAYDVTLDAQDILQDIHFSERFFAGFTGFASDKIGLVERKINTSLANISSRVALVSNDRKSAHSFNNEIVSESFMDKMSFELQLFFHPVGLAGGINPFSFYDIDLDEAKLRINGISQPTPISSHILDLGFLNQISAYKVKRVLLICASVTPLFLKYGVRSNRFINLEAGALSHGISLYCTELKVKSRVIGGFDDQVLAKHLLLESREVFPVVGIFIGNGC